MQYNIGLIGLAVMGENLVLNMANKGYKVAVYNRTVAKVDEFIANRAGALAIGGAKSIKEFVAMLEKPRKVIIMVKAGQPVDNMIEQLTEHLEKDDIIIDGGNSFFLDTGRRNELLKAKGIRFLGVGISGGEEGALKGPSLMPGGDLAAYKETADIFKHIAAQVGDDLCCSYVGPGGAGHYVKMVHNGIEYGDMQLISEAYYIMKEALGLGAHELHDVFELWNNGELNSYLIEITRDIFDKVDDKTGRPLLEVILDKAGQKGTGKWTSQSALDLGVPIPTITEAVFARCMSAYKEERIAASTVLPGPDTCFAGDRQDFIAAIHDALYAAKICSYAQGFVLLKAASQEYDWNLNYGEIALLWRGGCIIRAKFLDRITQAFVRDTELPNLLLDEFFYNVISKAQVNWRFVVKTCAEMGIAIPAISASLAYYDSYRKAMLPANLIQAQRDYFGAHTYERQDRSGVYHTDWIKG